MGSKKSLEYSWKPTPSIMARGGLLGFCHLTVMHSVLNFLEQPLDPFGTRIENVDVKTRLFSENPKPSTKGDRMINKLSNAGYFDQGREPTSFLSEPGVRGKFQFVNILLASLASSVTIALLMTPVDMVVFKQNARTTNSSKSASF